MCCICVKVPEQQQDQRVGAGCSGLSGLNPSGSEAESKPHQPDPRESLPAPEANTAVSTPGFHQLNNIVSALTRFYFDLSEQFTLQKYHIFDVFVEAENEWVSQFVVFGYVSEF